MRALHRLHRLITVIALAALFLGIPRIGECRMVCHHHRGAPADSAKPCCRHDTEAAKAQPQPAITLPVLFLPTPVATAKAVSPENQHALAHPGTRQPDPPLLHRLILRV